MVDKSKMTVAEMLAAARKADNKGDAPADRQRRRPKAAPAEATPAAPAAAAPAPAAKKPAAGGKPSVGRHAGDGPREEGRSAARRPRQRGESQLPKPAAAKAAPAKKEAAAASRPGRYAKHSHRRAQGAKPGPMTKAEAAAKGVAVAPPPKKAAKEAIVVPPMPVKPDYAKPPAERTSDGSRRAAGVPVRHVGAGRRLYRADARSLALWTLGTVRFMFPNMLREPPSRFNVGFPDKFRARARWKRSSRPNSACGS